MTNAEWFVYDPIDGASFYATEVEARDRAEALLEEERDDSGDGWNEHVNQICYGRVMGRVEQIKCAPAPEGSGFDEYWDFALKTLADPGGQAMADARVLAHSYKHDSNPPQDVVARALAYPVRSI